MFLPISRNITVSPVVMMDMLLACRSSTLKYLKVHMGHGLDDICPDSKLLQLGKVINLQL